jgi:hypothetical protein
MTQYFATSKTHVTEENFKYQAGAAAPRRETEEVDGHRSARHGNVTAGIEGDHCHAPDRASAYIAMIPFQAGLVRIRNLGRCHYRYRSSPRAHRSP